MGKSSVNGQFSIAMLKNQRVIQWEFYNVAEAYWNDIIFHGIPM